MSLTKAQNKFLRSLAHQLNPVIWIGQNGLTDAVIAEFDQALDHHELIKCSIRVGDREAKQACVDTLVTRSGAYLVQLIGNTATLYREHPETPSITLPK